MQAVNRSIVRLMPWTTVIEAKHCCYSVAHRIQDADGEWGLWELDVSQLHQVQVLGTHVQDPCGHQRGSR